jgi:small-conductance mechanosensitive channel
MKRDPITVFWSALLCLTLWACLPVLAVAQNSTLPAQTNSGDENNQNPQAIETVPPSADVSIDGRTILTVYQEIGSHTLDDRASAITKRIIAAAKTKAVSPDETHLQARPGWTEILVGDEAIMVVTDGDASGAGQPRGQLAKKYADNIRQAIVDYRRQHTWRALTEAILYTALTTVILMALLWTIRKTRFALRDRFEKWSRSRPSPTEEKLWHVSTRYLATLTLGFGAILHWIVVLAILEIYLTLTLSYFSATRHISAAVSRWLLSQVVAAGQGIVSYLPNLLIVLVIIAVTNLAVRLVRMVFGEIASGNLKIRGFYSDWAEPTEKLVRILIIILALIVVFPYLPGAKSPAFQGISIFLGVLISLGSSSAVANAVAGIILTYMRSFLVGDWVTIGDTLGEVTEKNLLVTRVRTPKEEIITLPNATVMSGAVKNYTALARSAGVIFYTTVTIGYNAPWRTVHQLLIDAGLATAHVLPQPQPFVLQRALNDFYVSYELNVYTAKPNLMLDIYSDLHRNIQDKFNQAGVEICSPHFSALRDGNSIAIPEPYLGTGYKAPAFRIEQAIPQPTDTSKTGPPR